MSETVANDFNEANTKVDTKEPSFGWMVAFLFIVSFIGLFSVVPLRKIMILRYKLTYPSGMATAYLINSFHTPQGALLARKQVSYLFKSFSASFLWSFFQWFYTAGENCGFKAFPTLGLEAYKDKFYFDFSTTYVGVGMLCPYMINASLLVGALISWGILWPYIESKKGDWYSETIPSTSLSGLNGYQVFISIAMILGDGLFHFFSVLLRTTYDMYNKRQREKEATTTPFSELNRTPDPALSFDDRRRTNVFLKDAIPTRVAIAGYLILATISIIAIPLIIPQLKSYHIIVAYLIAPVLAFCNCYGCGLTDWNLATSYAKLAIFIFGAWVGLDDGGVLAGLAACGVTMGIVSTASDLMQDFKTGYLTLASPRSMIISQSIGTAMGCVISTLVFWIFYNAFPLGAQDSEYPAPYAKVYRGIALLGVKGFDTLPKNCISFCVGFFFLAFAINAVREVASNKGWWIYNYVPSAMGMAIPFYLGSSFAIDMCVGSLIMFLWERTDQRHAKAFGPAVASGMTCGDGIWSLPASLLALWDVRPPICMKFLSRADNAKVDVFLTAGSSTPGLRV
nr:probable metal-nicotianamine transporter YSL8 isoform X2 [Elaeis guineensis]